MDFDRTQLPHETTPDYTDEEFNEVVALRLRRAELEKGSGYMNSDIYRGLRTDDPTEEELRAVRAHREARLEAALREACKSEIGRVASR